MSNDSSDSEDESQHPKGKEMLTFHLISLFPFSISFCVAQQNREQETPGGSGLYFMSLAQAGQQVILSHMSGIPHISQKMWFAGQELSTSLFPASC